MKWAAVNGMSSGNAIFGGYLEFICEGSIHINQCHRHEKRKYPKLTDFSCHINAMYKPHSEGGASA